MTPRQLPRSAPRTIALALLLPSLAAAGQEQRPTYRVSVEIVALHVAVTEGERPVRNLTAADFVVRENGVERPVAVLLAPSETPLDLALVLDYSESMVDKDTGEQAIALLDALEPSDCVTFVPFSQTVGPGRRGHPDDAQLRATILQAAVGGSTRLYDGILAAHAAMGAGAAPPPPTRDDDLRLPPDLFRFRAFDRARYDPDASMTVEGSCDRTEPGNRRRAILVMTDGADTASRASAGDVVVAGWSTTTPIFALANVNTGLGALLSGGGNRRAVERLERIVESAGGQLIREGNLGKGFGRLRQLLQSYYVVGYHPAEASDPGRPQWRRVDVRTVDPNHRVHVEGGVFTGDGGAREEATAAALRGLDLLASGRNREALAELGLAIQRDPKLAAGYYGRGVALSRLGLLPGAIQAFEAAIERAPWLAEAHARAALLLASARNGDGAWRHGIRAIQGGLRSEPLIDRLDDVAPPPPDLAERIGLPRVYLRTPRPSGLRTALIAEPLLVELGRSLAASDSLALGAVPGASQFSLVPVLQEVDSDEQPELRGSILVIDRRGFRVHEQKFSCGRTINAETIRNCMQETTVDLARRIEREIDGPA